MKYFLFSSAFFAVNPENASARVTLKANEDVQGLTAECYELGLGIQGGPGCILPGVMQPGCPEFFIARWQ